MKPLHFLLLGVVLANLILIQFATVGNAQQPSVQLPVELVGFPVIIMAVRVSNFVKKLAYSLNPNTYLSRTKRDTDDTDMIDVFEAERRLVKEMGENVCIYKKVCLYHAEKARKSLGRFGEKMDWFELFSNYKETHEETREYYLLSIFLGDLISSPKFCRRFARRGRECKE